MARVRALSIFLTENSILMISNLFLDIRGNLFMYLLSSPAQGRILQQAQFQTDRGDKLQTRAKNSCFHTAQYST